MLLKILRMFKVKGVQMAKLHNLVCMCICVCFSPLRLRVYTVKLGRQLVKETCWWSWNKHTPALWCLTRYSLCGHY